MKKNNAMIGMNAMIGIGVNSKQPFQILLNLTCRITMKILQIFFKIEISILLRTAIRLIPISNIFGLQPQQHD